MTKFKRYLNINEKTLKSVKKLISKGYFKKGFKEKFGMLKELNKSLSKIYKVTMCRIKVVPYWVANKSESREFLLIGDQLSLISFLAKFKDNLNFQKKNIDKGEVKITRDNFDWALSVIESSDQELIKRIFKAKEKSIKKKEEEKEWEERLDHTIQLEGGKT